MIFELKKKQVNRPLFYNMKLTSFNFIMSTSYFVFGYLTQCLYSSSVRIKVKHIVIKFLQQTPLHCS